jgi:tryptophan halogenase
MSNDEVGNGNTIKRIVIAGGGSAGWLSAARIAAAHQEQPDKPGLQITLIESPDVAPLGVGEGTWPSMRITLQKIGVSEADFFRECDASFKQGSRFNGWVDGSPGDFYFHPFALPQGNGDSDLIGAWQRDYASQPFGETVSVQPHMCLLGKAPKQFVTPEYAAVSNYGYHLDAGKLGLFLRKHCVERLGVRHVVDHIVGVTGRDDGDIAALETRNNGAINGDLFVDCTGNQSLLLGKHYGVPLISQQSILFNDSALVVQTGYANPDSPIASQTNSTAQPNGWIWDIGLPTRRGIGYVYSSAHGNDQQAQSVLDQYLAGHDGARLLTTPRKLPFQPGYRQKF